MTVAAQLFGEAAAHIIVVVVEHHHRALDLGPGHDVIRREHALAVGAGDGEGVGPPHPVAAPAGAGGDDHSSEAELADIVGREPAVEIDLEVGHLANLGDPVVPDAGPLGQPRQAAFPGDPAAELGRRLGEMDLIAALAQGPRAFESGRPGADDQHTVLRAPGRDFFGMPAAPPFLAHRRVLGAADRHSQGITRDADVTADALADVVNAPLLDLLGQERVGDGRARRADEIEHATLDLADHGVGGGEPAHADHRLGRHLLDESDVGLLRSLGHEARGARVVRPVGDIDIPQIRQLGQHFHDLAAFALTGDALGPQQLVDGEPHRHRAAVADGLFGVFDQLANEPHPVLQAASVLVATLVVAVRQELEGQIAVPGIDVDDVEPSLAGTRRRLDVPPPELADVLLVHGPALNRVVALDGKPGGRDGDFPAQARGAHRAAVPQLHPRQGAVAVHRLGHQRLGPHIFVVPEGGVGSRRVVRSGMDRAVLGTHDRPASFRLNLAQGGKAAGHAIAHPRAVGHLVEAVLRANGTDLDGLEENVVTRVAGHLCPPELT